MDLQAVGKRSLEWDMNNWIWDGDLFIANPVNSVPSGVAGRQFIPVPTNIPAIGNSSNSSPSCSGEVNLRNEKGKELEKRRRVAVIEEDNLNDEEVRSLSLKLCGNDYSNAARDVGNWEGNGGKKTKVAGGSTSRAACQVENCRVDLSNAKDYHRRHKVCEMHSKASKALVRNVIQRFCQQCSRFHALQEFDEGKRSCRRRLAGHNRRRRKTNPDAAANGNSLIDDQTSSYLLISLLKIIANMHSSRSDQTADQDILTRLLKSLQGNRGENGEPSINRFLQEQRTSLNDHVSLGNSEGVTTMISNGEGSSRPLKEHLTVPVSTMEQQLTLACDHSGGNIQTPATVKPSLPNNFAALSEVRENAAGPGRVNNFDLNDTYIDSDDGTDDVDRSPVLMNLGASSLDYPSHHSSPRQTSRNSDSASAQSPSSSNGDGQSRTDRIVFKLFGKEPNDLPLVLRAQILDWLSHSPTDIQSYIRPGCIILTVYLCQAESAWDEICYDLTASLSKLLDVSDASFWRAGWVYIRVQHQIALVHNGRVVLDTYLPPSINNYSKILSIKPIAISASERAQFLIKGFNLALPATRLLCAINGNYTVFENTCELADSANEGDDELQSVNFSCSIPALTGRGFIEIEDQTFCSSSFPFIVAESDVCSEIRMLEDALDFDEIDAGTDVAGKVEVKTVALDFIHELGWLLHRSQLKSRLGHLDPHAELFPLGRFKWLMAFSMDHEWCAVVKKLLNILLNGTVGTGEHSSMDLALSEMGLLHRAVRRNSRPLVEFLLRYVPDKPGTGTEDPVDGSPGSFLFRPDMTGPAGLTPLHIAAGKDGSEDVLDALTDDPGIVGIEAWKNARDSTDSTPEDYARLRGHYSYIHLVQKKISRRPAAGHVAVDIPDALSSSDTNQKQNEGFTNSFEIGQTTSRRSSNDCKLCHQKLAYITGRRSHLYRPVMLSMVAIAAVCVCAALLFKSSPEVVYIFRPFRWELLEYGAS